MDRTISTYQHMYSFKPHDFIAYLPRGAWCATTWYHLAAMSDPRIHLRTKERPEIESLMPKSTRQHEEEAFKEDSKMTPQTAVLYLAFRVIRYELIES